MKTSKETPIVPTTDEAAEENTAVDADVKPAEDKPIDPKEAARQRSKADLARQRRNLKNSRGKL